MASNRPEQFESLIEMMSRDFVTPDMAFTEVGALRLATFADEMTNEMGLRMLKEMRYFEGGRPMMAYHLPQQEPGVFKRAAINLPPNWRRVASALYELARLHPRADGSLPDLPGMSLEERGAVKRVARGEEGKTLKQTVLDMLMQPGFWVTAQFIQEEYDSTRLAAIIEVLQRKDGHSIQKEMRPNIGANGTHGAYHIFTDKEDERLYLAGRAEMDRLKALADEQALDRVESVKHMPTLAGGSKFGRWVQPQAAPAPGTSRTLFGRAKPAPAPVPSPRTASLFGSPPAPQVQSGAAQASFRGSGAGIPAARLDAANPKVQNNEIVQLDGVAYRRKFRAAVRDASGKVTKWEPYWMADHGVPSVPVAH